MTNPYPREYLALAPDVATLARAAAVTGGELDPAPAAVFDPAGEAIRYHEDLWPRFVGGAIALFLLDLLVRRVRLFDRKRTFTDGERRRARSARRYETACELVAPGDRDACRRRLMGPACEGASPR